MLRRVLTWVCGAALLVVTSCAMPVTTGNHYMPQGCPISGLGDICDDA